jgi:enediyne biosynthesis protein E4
MRAGSSYLSSEDPRLHFGFGNVKQVPELVVSWPGGKETRLEHVGADRLVHIEAP